MRRILLALAFLLPLGALAQTDLFGSWVELGVEKDITRQLSVDLGFDVRAQKKLRLGLSAGASYKVNKYLKLAAGYSFMERYRYSQYEDHYKGDIVDPLRWNGFNRRDAYWRAAHRATFDVSGTVKLWRWLRISLRERYQFTHLNQGTVDEYRERYDVDHYYDGDGQYLGTDYELKPGYPTTLTKVKPLDDDHVLRSRLKLEYDKKRVKLSPFLSGEVHNSLSSHMALEKVRVAAGLGYKPSKHHEVSLAYVLTFDMRDEDANNPSSIRERAHALNIGYNYKF